MERGEVWRGSKQEGGKKLYERGEKTVRGGRRLVREGRRKEVV